MFFSLLREVRHHGRIHGRHDRPAADVGVACAQGGLRHGLRKHEIDFRFKPRFVSLENLVTACGKIHSHGLPDVVRDGARPPDAMLSP
jgi:hypothetical protein